MKVKECQTQRHRKGLRAARATARLSSTQLDGRVTVALGKKELRLGVRATR